MTGGSPPAEIGISKNPDRLQTEISVTSMEMAGGSPPALVDIYEGPDKIRTEISVTSHVNDDTNEDLPESSAAVLRSPMIFQRPCVVSWAFPTLNQRIVNLTDVPMDMDADPLESSAPMMNSDLMIMDWEDIICGRPRYGGQDGHDMTRTVSIIMFGNDHNVRKRIDTADLLHMCRTVAQDHRWSDTDNDSDTDSVAELRYGAWDDACTGDFKNTLGNIQPGLLQNPPTYQIQDCETDDNSDPDSVADLEYIAWDDACAGEFQNMLGNIPPGLVQNTPTDNIRKLRNVRNGRLRCRVYLQRVG